MIASKAVIFDIDGVLLDSFQVNLKFFQNLLTWLRAAHAAGMQAVIYAPQPLSDADVCVSSFVALPGAVAGL